MPHHHLSDRQLLEHLLCRVEVIHEHQHVIMKEIAMSASQFQAQLDALTAAVADAASTFQTVAAGIDKEIQQLIDAQNAGGVTPAMSAQLQSSIDGLTSLRTSMGAAATRLGADDGTSPVVDPAAFAAAVTAARNAGATDVQLQAITALGDGVSPTFTKADLAKAIAAALAAAGDGSAPATADQLAALSALAA